MRFDTRAVKRSRREVQESEIIEEQLISLLTKQLSDIRTRVAEDST